MISSSYKVNALTASVYMSNLLIVPSPAPTIISPFGKSPMHLTPYENNFLAGPTLLNAARSIDT